jgi:hypothetical protein
MMSGALLQLAVEEDKVSPGLLGFCVVALIGAALWFLMRSMTKQMKRVDFEEKDTVPQAAKSQTAETAESAEKQDTTSTT